MGYFLVQSDFYFARSLVLFKHNTGKLSQARLFSRLVWLSRQSRQAKPRSRQMGGDANTVFGLSFLRKIYSFMINRLELLKNCCRKKSFYSKKAQGYFSVTFVQ